jgi:isopenicillin N synthase-like dioxygenase
MDHLVTERLSVAFFHHPNSDAIIEGLFQPEKYPPITAGAYLEQKFTSQLLTPKKDPK